jgi:dihydropyrimidinase
LLDTVIRGPLAVLPNGLVRADVGVGSGRIEAIGDPGELRGSNIVDADQLVLLPGAIDPHVHLNTRFGEWLTRDDFYSGTVPAAFGGTTTIFDFAIPLPGETARSAYERCRNEALATAVVDYALHACITRDSFAASLGELAGLRAAGIRSVKVFSAYRDTIGLSFEEIEQVLAMAAKLDLLVLVHAETDGIIEAGVASQVTAGNLGPRGHLASRPAAAEEDAIIRVAGLAEKVGARVFFVHVSSGEGAEAVRATRLAGYPVQAETCVQYLFLDDSVYGRPDGELWICSPPIRSLEHQSALWTALEDGTLEIISTDHNCFDRRQKGAYRNDFRRVPNGLPGVELRLPVLLEAVHAGRLSWERLARLTAEAPARVFGLWPRKGCLAIGSDADMVLVDPTVPPDLSASHMATDYSPFADLRGHGRVVQTWLRGRCLVDRDQFVGARGYGGWVYD